MMKSNYLKICLTFLIYSIAVVFGKYAAFETVGSIKFVILLFTQVLFMGAYAILWQLNLKEVKLNIAYSMKALTILFGVVAGVFLFNESIGFMNIIGILFVLVGIHLVVKYE